jgi:hypothetical protein
MGDYWKCLFFHKWTRWRRPIDGLREPTLMYGYQTRKCLRCGKIESYLVER